MDECRLSAANGEPGIPCGREKCIFWRVAGHFDLGHEADQDGCAVERYEMLESKGPAFAEWLLSVKRRIDDLRSPSE